MSRFTLDEEGSREYSTQRGVEYHVLRFNDKRVINDTPIAEIGQELFHYVKTPNIPNLCLDFVKVEFFSSACLGKLIITDKTLRSSQRNPLALIHLCPPVYALFPITRLDHLFDIDEASRDAYLRQCAQDALERTQVIGQVE
jgi:anti-anti-sigma regulatory factor